MVLIVCILFSFLISVLPIQVDVIPQDVACKALTATVSIITSVRQSGSYPPMDKVSDGFPKRKLPGNSRQFLNYSGPTDVSCGSSPPPGVCPSDPIGLDEPTAQSFCVAKSDIVEQGYDLSINRYKEVVHEEVDHRAPFEILDELESIEKEITQGMKQLRGMLK